MQLGIILFVPAYSHIFETYTIGDNKGQIVINCGKSGRLVKIKIIYGNVIKKIHVHLDADNAAVLGDHPKR